MTPLALLLCLLVATLGLLGLASPARLLALVGRFQTPVGLWVAAALRLVLGAALLLAADASRAPTLARVVGAIALLAGLATPLFGLERYRRLLAWWRARGPAFVRAWSLVALAFGVGLAWAVAP